MRRAKMELFEAVSANDVIRVTKLLERGIDPNQYNGELHYSALHYAVQSNALDVVLLLVTAGADLGSMTEENLTVFDIASEYQHEEMLHLLLKLSHMRAPRFRLQHYRYH
jgi:ankyrin repeat protein